MIKAISNIKTFYLTILALLLLVVLLVLIGVHQFYSYKSTLHLLKSQKIRLIQMQEEYDMSIKSIDQIKHEEEEFKGILFEERDVPAFLDGISGSAQKALVYVMEMKTQQFNKVPIPKKMLDLNKMQTQDTNAASTQDRLSDMLTLASMPIHFRIHGTFESIVNFLGSIENYRQLMTVSNVEISSRPDYPQLNCEFTLSIYSLKKFKDISI